MEERFLGRLPGNALVYPAFCTFIYQLPIHLCLRERIMLNTALSSFGAQVVLASSSDENHPPENIIDGKTETFWISTGMFPQEFILRFPDNMKISIISLHSFNVKFLRIEKSTQDEADKFVVIAEKELEPTDGSLQTNDISLDGSNATHLRFLILSGYDQFVSVHKVGVQA